MARLMLIAIVALGWLLGWSVPALAQGCCTRQTTLREDALDTPVLVRATLVRSDLKSDCGDSKRGSLKWIVTEVVQDASGTLMPKSILPAQVMDGAEGDYLVYCEYVKGKFEVWRALPGGEKTVDYLKGGLALARRDRISQMRYYFNFLEHSNPVIAKDAFKEFWWLSDGSYDFRRFANGLPVAPLIRWVEDKKVPTYRREVYAALLGHVGGGWGAVKLRQLVETACIGNDSEMCEGLLIGHTLLEPKSGWASTLQILGDPAKDFRARYGALRAARFFREVRPSKVDQNDLIAGVCLLLQEPDMADLVIEDLRRWGLWQLDEKVLALHSQKEYGIPVIHRSIIRYALSCPRPKAKEFIKHMRLMDRETVEVCEERVQSEGRELRNDVLRAIRIW